MTYSLVPLSKLLHPEYEESFLSPLAAAAAAFGGELSLRPSSASQDHFELTDDEKVFDFTIDLPGVKTSEISVSIEDDGRVLRVKVEREEQSNGSVSSRASVWSFERAFALKGKIDKGSVLAHLNQGILKVHGKKENQVSTEATVATKHVTLQEGFPEDYSDDESDEKGEHAPPKPYFEIAMELPGVRPSDLNVSVQVKEFAESFLLQVSGMRRTGAKTSQKFSRSYTVGRSVDIDTITAYLAHGILILRGSKNPKYDPVVIKVTEGGDMALMEDDEENADNSGEATRTHLESPSPRAFYYELCDNEKEFKLTIETPGMKASDLLVRVEEAGRVVRVNGKHLKSTSKPADGHFDKTFSVTRHPIDMSTVVANLNRGVLTVQAAKLSFGKAEKRAVVVEKGMPTPPPPPPQGGEPYFDTTLEFPGVKPSDMKVQVEDFSPHSAHVLHVSGSRKTGGTAAHHDFAKRYKIGASVNVQKLTAYLDHGILHLQAPKDERFHPMNVTVTEGEATKDEEMLEGEERE